MIKLHDAISFKDIEIIPEDDPRLKTISSPFIINNKKDLVNIQSLAQSMYNLMIAKKGIGLAAPQVGINKHLIVIKPEPKIPFITLINPEIIKRSKDKTQTYIEGCLSLGSYQKQVTRPLWVKVSFLDFKGRPKTRTFRWFEATIVQHEIDHLKGITLYDK